MTDAQFISAVKKFGGWIEADKAYFPTVDAKEQFVKWVESQK